MNDKIDWLDCRGLGILFLAFSPITGTQPTSISITGAQFFCISITRTQIAGAQFSRFQSLGLNPPAFQSLGLNSSAFQSLGFNPPAFQSLGLNSPAFQYWDSIHQHSTQFEHSTQSSAEELERAKMTELERMKKMNLEKGNAENVQEIDMDNPETLVDRMKVLLKTAKGADAHFLLVHAHKGILMASSKVFEEMFQKEPKNANDKIASVEKDGLELLIPDIDVEAFKVMLRFIYADDLSELNG
ncbi:hypothetical protein niasHT_017581 [Heterodera trifolii]|uniref:BTB domain-containing protein n=1 Tax=Heterodera trifolii TaxID=157864 RepID=A0ABD2LA93_9BILA